MEIKDLKKIIYDIFKESGLEFYKNSFYKSTKELLISIGLQKSTLTDGFYINLGYFIKNLHPNLKYPKYIDGDFRARFEFGRRKIKDILEINDNLNVNEITYEIQKNIDLMIDLPLKIGMIKYIEKNPILLYQATVLAKHYLKDYTNNLK